MWKNLDKKLNPKNFKKDRVHLKLDFNTRYTTDQIRRMKEVLLKHRWQIIVRPQGCFLSRWSIIWLILHSSEVYLELTSLAILAEIFPYK